MFFERTPVFCTHFSRGGSEIIIGSKHKSFFVYDMEGDSGVTFRPKLKGETDLLLWVYTSSWQIVLCHIYEVCHTCVNLWVMCIVRRKKTLMNVYIFVNFQYFMVM